MIERSTLKELLAEALEEYEAFSDDLVTEIVNRLEDYVEIYDDEDRKDEDSE